MKNAKNEIQQQQTQQSIINELQLKLVNQIADNEEKSAEIEKLKENNKKRSNVAEPEQTGVNGKVISTLDELQQYFSMLDKNTLPAARPEFVRLAPVAEYHLSVEKQLDELKQGNDLKVSNIQ